MPKLTVYCVERLFWNRILPTQKVSDPTGSGSKNAVKTNVYLIHLQRSGCQTMVCSRRQVAARRTRSSAGRKLTS